MKILKSYCEYVRKEKDFISCINCRNYIMAHDFKKYPEIIVTCKVCKEEQSHTKTNFQTIINNA